MTTPLRVAVIGGGEFGAEHVAVYRGMPSVHLVAIVETDEKRRQEWSVRLNGEQTEIFSSVTQMLTHSKIDAASVVTPSNARLEVTSELMKAGVDVLVEKPLADTPEIAQEIALKAASLGRICQPGHILRFSPDHQSLKSKISEGTLGAVIGVTLQRNRSRALSILYPDIHPALLLAVHDIDLAIWFTGKSILEVSAIEHRNSEGKVELLVAQCRHEDGAISTIHASCLLPMDDATQIDDQVNIYGTLGNAGIRFPKSDSAVAYLGVGVHNAPLVAEIRHFIDCVLVQRSSEISTSADGVHVVEVARAMMQSAESGGEKIRLHLTTF